MECTATQENDIMREIRIPKRTGGYRTVVSPSKLEKQQLRSLLPQLTATAVTGDLHNVQHGFTPTRSPVTNAAEHVGYKITLTWDLSDCFGHITTELVEQVASIPDACYVDGVARQGLPTSPAVCNIALSGLDSRIMDLVSAVRAEGFRCTYTRYADDLTISCDSQRLADAFSGGIPKLCDDYGVPVSPGKTRVQYAKAGRRHVTGIAVDDAGIHPTRAAKRRLRAARHQKSDSAIGLAEWCKLKAPSPHRFVDAHPADLVLCAIVTVNHTHLIRAE